MLLSSKTTADGTATRAWPVRPPEDVSDRAVVTMVLTVADVEREELLDDRRGHEMSGSDGRESDLQDTETA